ncbi:hypothetical protein GWI33_010414 [Rhynchophorus ferrugineus]|uniref:Uncharacterized protein n=1 Tax=Rhynchophorus ferrugineus TaxID=354439 RepID=A0A834IQT8_RHYFE|nr:hypothetical protein GWI33_010414 [Rhynchophorus ferrugineus]
MYRFSEIDVGRLLEVKTRKDVINPFSRSRPHRASSDKNRVPSTLSIAAAVQSLSLKVQQSQLYLENKPLRVRVEEEEAGGPGGGGGGGAMVVVGWPVPAAAAARGGRSGDERDGVKAAKPKGSQRAAVSRCRPRRRESWQRRALVAVAEESAVVSNTGEVGEARGCRLEEEEEGEDAEEAVRREQPRTDTAACRFRTDNNLKQPPSPVTLTPASSN